MWTLALAIYMGGIERGGILWPYRLGVVLGERVRREFEKLDD